MRMGDGSMIRRTVRRAVWSRGAPYGVIAALHVLVRRAAWSRAWTPTGRHLRPLRDRSVALGHRPRPWGLLFGRHAPYRVYWTRCRTCQAAGRLTVTQALRGRPPRAVAAGPLFAAVCLTLPRTGTPPGAPDDPRAGGAPTD